MGGKLGWMKRPKATHGTDIFARVGSTLCNFIPPSDMSSD